MYVSVGCTIDNALLPITQRECKGKCMQRQVRSHGLPLQSSGREHPQGQHKCTPIIVIGAQGCFPKRADQTPNGCQKVQAPSTQVCFPRDTLDPNGMGQCYILLKTAVGLLSITQVFSVHAVADKWRHSPGALGMCHSPWVPLGCPEVCPQ
eukprot:scaffold261501_cov18-Tisochrysis_lutea.AAC.1